MSITSSAYLPEVHYAVVPSPLGPLGLVRRGAKLTRIQLKADPESFPFEVERTYGTAGREDPDRFGDVRRELEEYFEGKRLVFRLPLDLDQGTPFQRQVWRGLLEIPYGRSITYKDLARNIGHPSAMRAVGSANGANPLPIVIPCHRVVASSGLGGYSGGLDVKEKLLDLEKRTRTRVVQTGLFPDRPAKNI